MLILIFYLINSLIKTLMVILLLIKQLMTIVSLQEKVDNIVNNNLPLFQYNNSNDKKEKSQNIIFGDSMLNSINSRGLSKSKKVSVSSFPESTNENMLGEPTLIVWSFMQEQMTLQRTSISWEVSQKLCEKSKTISQDTKIVFSNIIYR